jgi:hypothetical protein
MAIAYDTVSDSGPISSATSATWSHTCTGSNLLLFAAFFAATTDIVSGVTYNAVAMTFSQKVKVPSERYLYLYYITNPATGAHNIIASGDGSTNTFWRCFGLSYTGVAQDRPLDNSTTNTTAGATSLTTSVTTRGDNCWAFLVGKGASNDVTAGTGSTQRATSSGNGIAVFDSNGVITPAGSTSMAISVSPSQAIGAIMASFAPVAPANKIYQTNQAINRASTY